MPYFGRTGRGFVPGDRAVRHYGGRARDTATRAAKYQAGVAARRAASRRISQALADPMLQNVVMRGAPAAGEMKYKDTMAATTATATGNFMCIGAVARGDEAFERSGRQITVKSVQVRYIVRCPTNTVPTASQPFNCVRMMLFVDRQANASTPTLAQLLTDSTAGQACASNYNPEYKRRFYFLADQVVSSVPSFMTAASTGPTSAYRQILRFMNLKVEFNNGDAGTVADINTNAIWLVVLGDHALLGAGSDPNVQVSARVSFTDD